VVAGASTSLKVDSPARVALDAVAPGEAGLGATLDATLVVAVVRASALRARRVTRRAQRSSVMLERAR